MSWSAKEQALPLAGIIVISMALFSGHFGVGDVIFPAVLGRGAGVSWFAAAVGYGLINGLGVWIGYLAIARQQQTLFSLSSRTLGSWWGVCFTTICMLIIGPVFILPRVSSATYEMSVAPFFPNFPLWAMLLVFFILNCYVAYNRSQVIDRLGKVLSPALIVFMVFLILKGVVSPLAGATAPGSPHPLSDGILNGYNAMNALGAALFGGWILKEFALRGVKDKAVQTRSLMSIGFIVAFALFLTSTGLTYLGATTGTLYPEAQIGELSVKIASGLLGQTGLIIFAVLMALACFTTSVGLTSTAGDVFQEMTKGRLQYGTVVILSSIVGFVLGLVGLSRIVNYTVPWLMLVYPALVVLLLGGLFGRFETVRTAVAAATIVATLCAVGDFLTGLGFAGNIISSLVAKLPLGTQGLGWMVPTLAVFVVVQLISSLSGKKEVGA